VDVDPARVAAIIVEPVLGEGGFYPAPPEFLRELRRICDEAGILLIADEIQTGFGRTGRMFAIEHADIEADLVAMAKSLAGGFPLSAVTGRAEVMDAPGPGGLGGTYAGSPIACAAALAAIDVIEEEGLAERAALIGDRVRRRLNDLAARHTCIGDVRGIGAMVSMELVREGDPEKPDAERATALAREAAALGLVLLVCGVRGNVIRFLMPLNVPDSTLEEGLQVVERAMDRVTA